MVKYCSIEIQDSWGHYSVQIYTNNPHHGPWGTMPRRREEGGGGILTDRFFGHNLRDLT